MERRGGEGRNRRGEGRGKEGMGKGGGKGEAGGIAPWLLGDRRPWLGCNFVQRGCGWVSGIYVRYFHRCSRQLN